MGNGDGVMASRDIIAGPAIWRNIVGGNMSVRRALILAAVIALAVLATGCASEVKPDSSSPKAAVRAYLGYLSSGETSSAYGLLSKAAIGRCDSEHFLQRSSGFLQDLENSRVVFRGVTELESSATVRASVDPGRVDVSPLGPRSFSHEVTYLLVKEGGEWRLSEVGWPYFYCDTEKGVPPEQAVTPVPTDTPRPALAPAPAATAGPVQ